MIKRQETIIYLDTNKLLFYIKESKISSQLDLPLEVVSDLEVVNKQKFNELVDLFFQKENFKGMEFDGILVFSQEITFEKDFTDDTVKAQYDDTQKFLNLVPFEEVLSNAYKINKKTKVVALNKALFDSVNEAFERNKVYISSAIPAAILVETSEEFAKSLDLGIIAAKSLSLKQYSIIDLSKNLEGNKKNLIGIRKKDVRLYLLIGIFILLLIVLAVLIYSTFLSPKPKINKKPVVLAKTSVTPVVTKETTLIASESGKISSQSSLLE